MTQNQTIENLNFLIYFTGLANVLRLRDGYTMSILQADQGIHPGVHLANHLHHSDDFYLVGCTNQCRALPGGGLSIPEYQC